MKENKQNKRILNIQNILVNDNFDYHKVTQNLNNSFVCIVSGLMIFILLYASASLTVGFFEIDIQQLFSSFDYIKEQGLSLFFIYIIHFLCFIYFFFNTLFCLFSFFNNLLKLFKIFIRFKTISYDKIIKIKNKDYEDKIKLFDIEDLSILISTKEFKNDFYKEQQTIIIDTIKKMKKEKLTNSKKVFIENY